MPADAVHLIPDPSSIAQTAGQRRVVVQTFTYEERREVSPAVAGALERCGAWVLERTAASPTQTRLRFDMQLRGALDLYTALIGAGLELTRDSHLRLTNLCTVRKHQRTGREPLRTVEIVLEVSFLDEMEVSANLLAGVAVA